MEPLTRARCVPCRGGMPPLTPEEIRELSPQVPDWRVVEHEGVSRIEREFRFPDFRSAMAFAVAVGEVAEEQGHHPDLHVGYGRVTVETWTHAIRGLHRNDFILAAKTDEVLAKQPH
jgi:4a-hydroxytetrahydrobiopterin dehydratase